MEKMVAFFQGIRGEELGWLIAFMIGSVLFLIGVVSWLRKTARQDTDYAKAAVWEFLAIWVMYVPEELFNEMSVDSRFLRWTESILTALLRSFNVYNSSDYERVLFQDHMFFSSLYGIVRVLSNIALILFVGGFLVKFLDGPFQKMKLSLFRKRYVYVFPSCNEKVLAIARTIPDYDAAGRKVKKNIVFAYGGKQIAPELRGEIDRIGGLCVDSTIGEILCKYQACAAGMEVFLFEEKEENNLLLLDTVCQSLDRNINVSVKIYVELSKTPWDLYDDYTARYHFEHVEKVIVNFVRAEEIFAYNNLLKHSIFEKAKKTNDIREIKFLIVGGMNDRNLEMLKAVLHLSQMPGYELTLLVLDDGEGRAYLRQRIPELEDQVKQVGDAVYTMIYKENIDFSSNQMETVLQGEFCDFTFAFVNVGGDLENVNLAMRLNAICRRANRSAADYDIQVSMVEQSICDKWNPMLLAGIQVVGGTHSVYHHDFVTMSDIEKCSKAIHEVRSQGARTWEAYCNSEYSRHSVYARTLSFVYKVQLLEQDYEGEFELTSDHLPDEEGNETNIWKIYEHMRWNMYTRTLGLRLCPKELLDEQGELSKELRSVAMVHNDLVPFEELPKDEQEKDSLKLTPAIVQILKSVKTK